MFNNKSRKKAQNKLAPSGKQTPAPNADAPAPPPQPLLPPKKPPLKSNMQQNLNTFGTFL